MANYAGLDCDTERRRKADGAGASKVKAKQDCSLRLINMRLCV
jgi:hypothetical protein